MESVTPLVAKPQLQKGTAEQAQPRQKQAESPPPPAQVPASPLVNPAVRFDPRLSLLVVEFLDNRGQVVNSAPSPSQLKAYESLLNLRSGPTPVSGELPAGLSEDRRDIVT